MLVQSIPLSQLLKSRRHNVSYTVFLLHHFHKQISWVSFLTVPCHSHPLAKSFVSTSSPFILLWTISVCFHHVSSIPSYRDSSCQRQQWSTYCHSLSQSVLLSRTVEHNLTNLITTLKHFLSLLSRFSLYLSDYSLTASTIHSFSR